MKMKGNPIIIRHKNILRVVLATALVLLAPLIAMQFSDEVNWDAADFIIIGALAFGTGLTYELVSKSVKNPKYRVIIGIVLLAVSLLIWAELAVGIFNTPFSGS